MNALADRVAFVTGAGAGIGRAISHELAGRGAIVVCADIDIEAAWAVAAGCGGGARAVELDVAIRERWRAAVADVERNEGHIDILVNNAGIVRDAFIHKMTDEQWDAVIDVHLRGTFLGIQTVAAGVEAPGMRERGGGKIVNISSIAAKVGNLGQANYAAAKAGIVALTKVAAKELARSRVCVNAVQPGLIETAMTSGLPEHIRDQKIAEIPLERVGTPKDVARVVAFLASSDSDYMTGAVLEVAGGRYM